MKSKDESPLATVLEFVRDPPEPIAVPAEIWKRLAAKLMPTSAEIQLDGLYLFDLLQIVAISLIYRFLRTPTDETRLRGLIVIYLQYLDPMHRGASVAKAFSAFNDLAVAEGLFRLLHDHSCTLGEPLGIQKGEMAGRLARLAATHKRTAERHVQPAKAVLCNVLGESLQELYALVSSAPAPVLEAETDDAIDVAALIEQYTLSKFSLAPSAYGVKIPIPECISRSLHIKGEPYAIESKYLANHLAGRCGTVSGLPGSGRSTLMRFVASHGNQGNINGCCFFYFSTKAYLDFAKQGYTCSQYIVSQLLGDEQPEREYQSRLVAQVDDLNRRHRLILLADDLECLDGGSRKLVVSKLAPATAIYFSITPWLADAVQDEMRRCDYKGNLISLILDGLDLAGRESIAALAAKYKGVRYVEGSLSDHFDDWNAEEGTIALGVIAALQAGSVKPGTKHLQFGYCLLCEFLRRDGYARIHLPEKADELDVAIARLIRTGKVAREQIMLYESNYLFRPDADTRMTVSVYLEALRDLLGDPIEDLLQLRIFRLLRYAPTFQFVYPSIEELLMTLDCY